MSRAIRTLWPPLERVPGPSNRCRSRRRPIAGGCAWWESGTTCSCGSRTADRHRRHPRLAAAVGPIRRGCSRASCGSSRPSRPRGRAICRASRSHSRPPRYPMGPSPFSTASAEGRGRRRRDRRRGGRRRRRSRGGRRGASQGAAVQRAASAPGRRGRRRGLFVAWRRRREHAQGDCRAARSSHHSRVQCGRVRPAPLPEHRLLLRRRPLPPRPLPTPAGAARHLARPARHGVCRAARAPAPSLVISRQISAALGEQTYLPGRLLHGLLPPRSSRCTIYGSRQTTHSCAATCGGRLGGGRHAAH